jgi:eukaryotic-like serine/threonine-protein kinase
MTLAAGTKLGPYEILSPLGAGGMGEVYRARDRKLDRDVAVKVLPQTVANDPDSLARFEREAKSVAALSHPNILAIYDFGSQDGVAYAVTELLEGETLRGKLDGSPVSQRQAVDWALQIAKGLSAAHGKGVVHRDLKPDNVFVTKDGHVKILDFGLAKRVDETQPDEKTSAPTGTGHTQPGTVMGTMGYMSPEQLRGLPVDHRSDIFSFGAILYELLSGRKAFKKDTASDTIAAVLKEDPPELTQSGRNVSPALDHIVRHCLEKDRENRFQTAKDVAFALSEASESTTTVTSGAQAALSAPPRGKRPLWIIAAIVAVLAVAGILWSRKAKTGGAAAGTAKRIAVLPFENLGSPEDDYFADGIADQIRGKLASLAGVEVIARASSTPYKKTTKTPKQIADELNAQYLLTATVRWQKSGGTSRVQVSPELVDVTHPDAPTTKWQQPFDASLTDVFQVQSDIAAKVADGLGVALAEGEKKTLSEKPTENLAAYDAFLKGEEVSTAMAAGDPPTIRKALGYYEQAIALDPAFAQGWARVSVANSLLYANAAPEPRYKDRARQAAEKSLAIAPNRPEGYQALGTYYRLCEIDMARAREQYAKGLALAPNNTDLLGGSSAAEQAAGLWDQALEHARQAERLDPRSMAAARRLGALFVVLRRYPEAKSALDRALALNPANLNLIQYRMMASLGEGDLAGARSILDAALKHVDPPELLANLTQYNDLYWAFDDSQRQQVLTFTPSSFADDRGAWGLCLAEVSALMGDMTKARNYAEAALPIFDEELRAAPDDDQRHILRGLAFAYMGRKEEAVKEGLRGVALDPLSKDITGGAYDQHQLARIYILVGEPEKAIDQLEPLLKIPYFLSPGWLKIDPNFDPLRNNPRFQKLVAGAK